MTKSYKAVTATADLTPDGYDPVLNGALKINEGRSADHGDPEDSFQRIADYWTVYLNIEFGMSLDLAAEHVAELMTLFKLARAQSGRYNVDDYRDGAGYLSHANRLRNE